MTSTHGVMSAYHPSPDIVDNLVEAAGQLAHVVVVDDTPGDLSDAWHSGLPTNVTVLRNGANLGLASSLNRGIRHALAHGAKRVLTLDQDTNLPAGYVATLSACLDDVQSRGIRCLVAGPWGVGETPSPRLHTWEGGTCTIYVMQSGTLIDAGAFAKIGYYREDYFIDGLEHEFLLRLHAVGEHVVLCPGLYLTHAMGTPQQTRFLGRTFQSLNHAPFRRYYMWRNITHYAKAYRRDHPDVTRHSMQWLGRELMKDLIAGTDRRALLASSLRGFRDGVRGRLGPRA